MLETQVKVNNANAVIYARYSSDAQSEQSIEGQVHVINEYAKRNNIPIIDSYIDRAISGRSDDRPEFQRMIKESKARGFGYVLVYKFDRFSRDRYNSLLYKRELKKNGVKVVSVTEYISDDPQGILFESIIDGYSEYYSAELAQKVKRGNRESRLKGQYTGGHVLYGYDIVNKKPVINEAEAAVVRKIFTDVCSEITYKTICDDLISQGIKHNDKPFTVQSIHKLIKNTKYTGKCTVDGEEYTNIYPQIITEEQYKMANKRSLNNQGIPGHFRTSADYLLSNKCYCGCCGSKMIGESGRAKSGKTNYYYKCNTKKKKLGECDNRNFRKTELEKIIINNIKEAILHSIAIKEIATHLCEAYNSVVEDDPLVSLNESAITKNKNEIENIMKAIKAGIFNDAIKEELDKLQEEKKQLEIEKIKLSIRTKKKIDVSDALSFLYSLIAIDSKEPDYAKMLIKRFVRRIVVFKDRVEVTLYPIDNQAIFALANNNGGGSNNNSSNSSNNKENPGNLPTSLLVRH